MNHLSAQQRGLSLIELLIALLIGLILLLGISQVFLTSRQTFATNNAMSKLQENGRFALEFIARSARQAGYLSPGSTLNMPYPAEPTTCGLGTTASNPCAVNRTGSGTASDQVSFAAEPVTIDGALRDCAGTTVSTNKVIINSYFIVAADANNPEPALACSSYNRTDNTWITKNQRLIDGIESLQVLYGVNTTGNSKSVDQFVSADRVSNWSGVLAVRIAVLANSLDDTSPTPPQRNYYLLDAAPVTPGADDRKTRQIFTTTIHFKNVY